MIIYSMVTYIEAVHLLSEEQNSYFGSEQYYRDKYPLMPDCAFNIMAQFSNNKLRPIPNKVENHTPPLRRSERLRQKRIKSHC